MINCQYYKKCICILELEQRINKLKDLLGELFDNCSYEFGGKWMIDDENLLERVEQILKEN